MSTTSMSARTRRGGLVLLLSLMASLFVAPQVAAKEGEGKKVEDKHSKVAKGPVELPQGRTAPLAEPEGVPSPLAAAAAVEVVRNAVDLKVLVLAGDGTEADLPAIRQALDYLGTPYDVVKAAPVPADASANRFTVPGSGLPALVDGDLATATRGAYNAVILTNGSLYYNPGGSALTPAEWTYLWAYEARFAVRQVSWYTYPTADYGFGPDAPTAVDTSTTSIAAPFTAAGKATFSSYLNTGTPVTIRNAYTYLAKPLDAATVPLLSDAGGNALAAVRTYPDGRENLALTFDSNAYLLHNLVLSYGLVNWATRGLFLGERRAYLSAQVDDLFIDNTMWPPGTACGTPVDSPTLPVFRITGNDLRRTEQWQSATRNQQSTGGLRLNIAYNGVGTTPLYYADHKAENPGAPASDTLTPRARNNQGDFNWISHTYTHANLDGIGATEAATELQKNHEVAQGLGLSRYSPTSLVQPDVSGLANGSFLSAAASFGVRQVVSDTSKGGTNANPSPNAGVRNALQPEILQIPRRPNNLYFNVSTPAEWLAEDNCLYPAGAFGHAATYDQLLDRESNVLVSYLLLGDVDPWMFHQANLRAYDGTHSLLSDLLDRTLSKYRTYFTLPIVSPTMDELAGRITNRMRYNASSASGSVVVGTQNVTVGVVNPASVPVTGVNGPGAELYGGQYITVFDLGAGGSTSVNPAPEAVLNPTSLTFPNTKVGKSSDRKTVTLTNTGTTPLGISAIAVTGDFTRAGNCGTSLAAKASCKIHVTFKPSATGNRTGTLTVTDDAPGSPHTVALSGSGK